ncbi:MAG TPA: ATP-dependent helicase HrpB [Acidimicrobiales bacterium]|jgi:ATP-dependent helicase HrpB|nr:ATP-dependent helicase HrpB [Acidimicrobiales bacterium]
MVRAPITVPPTGLPIEEVVDDVRSVLAGGGAAVLQAEPGAGKTTIVPLRLLGESWVGDGMIVVLEPRRVAARAAAARMATLVGDEVGGTVGFSTRDERRVGPRTRVEVITDGIWTRRIQRDPILDGVAAIVFDEFHERHLQADLGLALSLDVRDTLRPDLRVLVMSATIEVAAVSGLLGDVPVISSRGRTFPIEVRWAPPRAGARPGEAVASVVERALVHDRGDVLAFLPGVGEIAAAQRALGSLDRVDVVPLYGALSPTEQDRALRSGVARRVVLATDLAESSVTVEGVGVVVDAGLVRRPAYDPATGLSRLSTFPTSRASADQRAGRSGRGAPGVAYRMWSEAEHLARRAWPVPEIATADLAPLALELAVWGLDAGELRWLDPPSPAAMAVAETLLEELGATAAGRPTELGRRLAELPLHPRLGKMLLTAPPAGTRTAALLAALLSERDIVRRGQHEEIGADVAERLAILFSRSDRGSVVDRSAVSTVRRRADELVRRVIGPERSRTVRSTDDTHGSVDPGPLLLAAYPDRIAHSRGRGRYRLRHGSGAVLRDHDPLVGAEWLVAAEIDGAGGHGRADGQIRLAAVLDRADVEAVGRDGARTVVRVEWDEQLDDLRARSERVLDALVLDSTRAEVLPGPETAAALIAYAQRTALGTLGWTGAARALQARVRWARETFGDAWPDVTDSALADGAEEWLEPLLGRATKRADLAKIDPSSAIRAKLGGTVRELDRLVPSSVGVGSGRMIAVDYSGERPRIALRAQDLYGTTTHPTIADGRVPVTVEVLSPAGRPIQVTADLPRFWSGSWREVRREMATRYPKHHWPEDPSTLSGPSPRRRSAK